MSNFAVTIQNILAGRAAKGYAYNGFKAYRLTAADAAKFEALAHNYGFPPEWLANLVNFESGGTFNPAIKNSIGATGLIQFLISTAAKLGTTTAELAKMSFIQQLTYLDKYLFSVFTSVASKRGLYDPKLRKVTSKFTQQDLFMAIFYPDAIGKPGLHFPIAVKKANNGIVNPADYVKKALGAATTPFRNIGLTVQRKVQEIEHRRQIRPLKVILIVASISGALYLTYKYRRNLGLTKA